MLYDVAIVGSGPAGIIAALECSKKNLKICLIDQNEDIGKKLAITGGGRCNVSSTVGIDDFGEYVKRNYKFLLSAFKQFSNDDLINYLKTINVSLKVEDNKYFLKDDDGANFVRILKKQLISKGITLAMNTRVLDVVFENDLVKHIKTSKGIVVAKEYLLSSGGLSYKNLGSDGSIFKILKEKNIISIIDTVPCLVPVNLKNNTFSELAGISVEAKLVCGFGKVSNSLEGELLFTHKGISGPVVLNFSSFLVDKPKDMWDVYIDFLPRYTFSHVFQIFEKIRGRGKMSVVLRELLPKKLIKNLFPEDEYDFSNLGKKVVESFVNKLKNNHVEIDGFEGYNKAIVTRGGVDVREINPKSMRSKVAKNLYFAGEIIDVDGFTGGYNLQIAFSTGYVAGKNIGGM